MSNSTASNRIQLIEEVNQMENLIGPLNLEYISEENFYFTDGDNNRYFFKFEGRELEAKMIRRYLR